jgi:mannose-6-phosphate isomerase-like protein (cupin superfamily)
VNAKVTMPSREVSNEEMAKRVARYQNLVHPPERYPDSLLPGHERRNFLVIGTGLVVDGAKDPLSAIPISEGFTLSYVEAKPGNGPKLHNHDTNETFVAIRGRWRVIWGAKADHHVDLEPLDVCSVPPGVPRRFINVSEGDPEAHGLLMTVQAGDQPRAEFLE